MLDVNSHLPTISLLLLRRTPRSTLFPYTTLFRSRVRNRLRLQMGALRDFVADLLETEGSAVERVEPDGLDVLASQRVRSEEHTSELQSQSNLVCRLLLEKKKKTSHPAAIVGSLGA